jgi:hypothetical protein
MGCESRFHHGHGNYRGHVNYHGHDNYGGHQRSKGVALPLSAGAGLWCFALGSIVIRVDPKLVEELRIEKRIT